MPVHPEDPRTSEKLDIILWYLAQQQVILTTLTENVENIMTEQADYNTDIQALTTDLNAVVPFLAGLPAQLTAIQTALANQGVTDISELDNLVTQANGVTGNVSSLNTTLQGMPGGTPATTPPASS